MLNAKMLEGILNTPKVTKDNICNEKLSKNDLDENKEIITKAEMISKLALDKISNDENGIIEIPNGITKEQKDRFMLLIKTASLFSGDDKLDSIVELCLLLVECGYTVDHAIYEVSKLNVTTREFVKQNMLKITMNLLKALVDKNIIESVVKNANENNIIEKMLKDFIQQNKNKSNDEKEKQTETTKTSDAKNSKTANDKKEKTVVNNNRASHHCNCHHSQKTKDKSKKNDIDFKTAVKWLENNVAFGNITVSEQEAITLFNFFNSKQVRELVATHGVHPLPNGIWWTRLQQYNPTNLKYAFAAPCGDGTVSIVLMFDPNTMDWVFTKEFSNMLA